MNTPIRTTTTATTESTRPRTSIRHQHARPEPKMIDNITDLPPASTQHRLLPGEVARAHGPHVNRVVTTRDNPTMRSLHVRLGCAVGVLITGACGQSVSRSTPSTSSGVARTRTTVTAFDPMALRPHGSCRTS